MDKLLARMIRNNEKKHKVSKLGRREVTSVQTIDIKRIIRENY